MKDIFIVTGANGFLGNNVVRVLNRVYEGAEVRALIHRGSKKPSGLAGLNCKIYECDVNDKDTLNDAFIVPKTTRVFVIHAAAIVTIKAKNDPIVNQTNIGGTKNVIEKVLEINAKLVYVSSVHAIPVKPGEEKIVEVDTFDPQKVDGLYAETKAEAANLVLDAVRERGLNACIVHPSGMIGPNDFGLTHLTKLIRDLANGSFRIMVDGGYDFVDVRDVSEAIVTACEKGKAGECYILSNKVFSIKETADLVCDIMGYKKIKFKVPLFLCHTFAPLCEFYYNLRKIPPLFTKLSLRVINSNGNFDNSKARAVLNFNPMPFEKTIKDTISFMEENGIVTVKRRLLLNKGTSTEIVKNKNEGKI